MNAAEIEELLIKLVQIPAPTGREQKRAEYITDWLKELDTTRLQMRQAMSLWK